jgi:hypothetical protein
VDIDGENEMSFGATDIPTSYVQREREALAGLESKLSDALDRRGKTIHEISRACAKAETTIGINSARNSLGPLNKRARAIDSEISLLRINISEARRHLELAEAHAENAKAKQAVTGRLVQLEIRTRGAQGASVRLRGDRRGYRLGRRQSDWSRRAVVHDVVAGCERGRVACVPRETRAAD